jgi:hypothetical protein
MVPSLCRTEPAVELPTLEPGINLLESSSTGPLQSLVLDHLLLNEGQALWVDSRGQAGTTALARLAPSRRLLERVQVARGFTPYQHYSLVETLQARLEAPESDVSLVVVPLLDHHYRSDDLRGLDGNTLVDAVADRLATIATTHDVPVLVTREETDAISRPIDCVADTAIACEETRFGPRFVGDEFETLVYRDSQGYQTTLAFWAEVLAERASTVAATGVSSVGAH